MQRKLSDTLPEFEATDKAVTDENKTQQASERKGKKKSAWHKIKNFLSKIRVICVIIFSIVAALVKGTAWIVSLKNDISNTKDKVLEVGNKIDKLVETVHEQDILIKENSVKIRNIKEILRSRSK